MENVSTEKIVEIINGEIDDINLHTEQIDEDLVLMGMDSISFIRIVVSIEEEFECEIPDEKLLISQLNTVSKIYEVLCSLN